MVAFTKIFTSAVALASSIHGVVAQTPFVVTGSRTGGVQPRYELRDLEADHYPMWNLFLQAMERLQHDKQSHKASFYDIATIHGAPFQPWDGVKQTGNGQMMCPHSSNIFIPWHRPYLALMEQRLSFWAHRIANEFPAGQKRKTYQKAAKELRLPYWDWARNGKRAVPSSLVADKIKVTRPHGKKAHIRNPLKSYHFHPLNAGALVYAPQNQWHETKRQPTSDQPNAKSNEKALEATFKSMRPSLRQSVYSLMANGGKYNKISNWGTGTPSLNFEAIHNNIHSGCGLNSHMYNVAISTYDPIFWFHHANVDRLMALWQHLYPATYVKPTKQENDNWNFNAGSTLGPHSPLKPFHKNERGQFWTSAEVRSTHRFHYTYPELRGNPSKAKLRQRINHEYGSASGVAAGIANSNAKRNIGEFISEASDISLDLDINPGDALWQYSADITMPTAINNQQVSILIFLGDITTEIADWTADPNLVGLQSSLGNMDGAFQTAIVGSSVILTHAILEKFVAGDLDSLDKDTVEAYLEDNLHWRATQLGQQVPEDQGSDIAVHLLIQAVEAPLSDTDFPNYMGTNPIAPINMTIPANN